MLQNFWSFYASYIIVPRYKYNFCCSVAYLWLVASLDGTACKSKPRSTSGCANRANASVGFVPVIRRKSRFRGWGRGLEFSFLRTVLCALGDLIDSVTAAFVSRKQAIRHVCLVEHPIVTFSNNNTMFWFKISLFLSFLFFTPFVNLDINLK